MVLFGIDVPESLPGQPFVRGDGRVRCWDKWGSYAFLTRDRIGCMVGDKRALRKEFREAGLVVEFDDRQHLEPYYKRLPQSWTYSPY